MIGINFNDISESSFYRIVDKIIAHRETIEHYLFAENKDLYSDNTQLLLYDLTNSYFEGKTVSKNKKRGHSKEKRSDCLLVSLALFVDSSGYIKKSFLYPGNISEPSTLATTLEKLNPARNVPIIMDRGIATAENIEWLIMKGYKYIVANREQHREFDSSKAISIKTRNINTCSGSIVSGYKEVIKLVLSDNKIASEARVICHSLKRQKKEEGMNSKNCKGFEDGLTKLKNTIKKSPKKFSESNIAMKIGILKKTFPVSVHYEINIVTSVIGRSIKVTGLTYKFNPRHNTKMTHPGVYSIRTNILNLSEQEIWETYTKQTIVESVFSSLKSELGLRPIFHRKDKRIDVHFFISILAYQCVNWIRSNLKLYNINYSWDNIALKLAKIGIARRITLTPNGRFVKRYVSTANYDQRQIYNAVDFTCYKTGFFNRAKLQNLGKP